MLDSTGTNISKPYFRGLRELYGFFFFFNFLIKKSNKVFFFFSSSFCLKSKPFTYHLLLKPVNQYNILYLERYVFRKSLQNLLWFGKYHIEKSFTYIKLLFYFVCNSFLNCMFIKVNSPRIVLKVCLFININYRLVPLCVLYIQILFTRLYK